MAYTHLDPTKPDPTLPFATNWPAQRANFAALRDAVISGCSPGWSQTPSYDGNGNINQILAARGTERVRGVIAYKTVAGMLVPDTTTWSYSSNSGGSYETYSVETASYDVNGRLTGIVSSEV